MMRMRWGGAQWLDRRGSRFVNALLMLVLAVQFGVLPTADAETMVDGTLPCAEWLKMRASGNAAAAELWLSGVLLTLAAAEGVDVRSTDPSIYERWMAADRGRGHPVALLPTPARTPGPTEKKRPRTTWRRTVRVTPALRAALLAVKSSRADIDDNWRICHRANTAPSRRCAGSRKYNRTEQ